MLIFVSRVLNALRSKDNVICVKKHVSVKTLINYRQRVVFQTLSLSLIWWVLSHWKDNFQRKRKRKRKRQSPIIENVGSQGGGVIYQGRLFNDSNHLVSEGKLLLVRVLFENWSIGWVNDILRVIVNKLG